MELETKNIANLTGLVILVFILLFLLANFGYISPCSIPGFSGVYYGIKGYPRIAIVSGSDGMGDAEKLRNILIQRKNVFPVTLDVEDLKTGGVLDNYQMVIVDHAKTIDTAALYAFRDYVQKGGRLVWIGDAGTGLGENDYYCEKVEFAYLPATIYTNDDGSFTQCAPDWIVYSPNVPERLESGLCGKDFADVVVTFVRENKSIYESAFTGTTFPCPDVDNAFQVKGADKILSCLSLIGDVSSKSDEEIKQEVNEKCTYSASIALAQGVVIGNNHWRRGAVETDTGKKLPAFDFGATVIGADYVASAKAELFLKPVDPDHPLVKGYEVGSDVGKYFGSTNFSIVSTLGYEMRSKAVMNAQIGGKTYPAMIVSSPVGPLLAKTGLVTYYAFPLEDLIYEDENGDYKGAVNLVDNLVDYLIC